MKRACHILVCLAVLAGCSPKPVSLGAPPEGASPEYRKGWSSGCESGFAATGNSYYKTFYKFNYDGSMLDNKIYSNAWRDAFNYCRHYITRYLASGMWWGDGSGNKSESIFNYGDFRNKRYIEEGASLWPEAMQGLNTPGWGEMGWGGSIKEE